MTQKTIEFDAPQRQCDEFNARYPVGTTLGYRPIAGHDICCRQVTTATEAYVAGREFAVVLVEQMEGGVLIEHLEDLQ